MNQTPAIKEFFGALHRRIDVMSDYRQKLNRQLAQDLNLIDFLRPDEYRMSELFANLLDPMGFHGQGCAFLEVFLAQLNSLDVTKLLTELLAAGDRVTVKQEEVTRAHRRIDIVISIGQAAIGIENKPWAGPQIEQLAHYATELERRYRAGWALMYVSGDGVPPAEISLPKVRREELLENGHYVEWTYKLDIARWLDSCIKICEADKMRWLLRDFRSYVLNNFTLAD